MMVVFDPFSYEEASHDPMCKRTMQEYFKYFQHNKTWELVHLPSKRKLVQCKWVYRRKFVVDGYDIKYKYRLVSKGLSQISGVDYAKTFASIAKMDSIRLVLAIATSKRCEVQHMDVKSDFIHGEFHEVIFM